MPVFLLFIAYFLLEGYSLAYFWQVFGFVNLLFALLVGAVLGIGILRTQGRYMIFRMQQSLARGQTPTDDIILGIMSFAAGILFLIPGFISDLVALFFILPGLRWIALRSVKRRIGRMMSGGNFRVFTYGMGMRGPGPGGGFYTGPQDQTEPPEEGWMRDVSPRVIDVKPVVVDSDENKPQDN